MLLHLQKYIFTFSGAEGLGLRAGHQGPDSVGRYRGPGEYPLQKLENNANPIPHPFVGTCALRSYLLYWDAPMILGTNAPMTLGENTRNKLLRILPLGQYSRGGGAISAGIPVRTTVRAKLLLIDYPHEFWQASRVNLR